MSPLLHLWRGRDHTSVCSPAQGSVRRADAHRAPATQRHAGVGGVPGWGPWCPWAHPAGTQTLCTSHCSTATRQQAPWSPRSCSDLLPGWVGICYFIISPFSPSLDHVCWAVCAPGFLSLKGGLLCH